MVNWNLIFTPEAADDFKKLDTKTRARISNRLEWLRDNFNNITPSALSSEWRDYFKFRVSDWRIIYKINWINNKIIIYVINRRDKVYKRK